MPTYVDPVTGLVEDRDGPTEEFRQKHQLTYLKDSAARRRLTGMEQLLLKQQITPEEFEAGYARFAVDWLKGYVGKSKSSWDMSGGGAGAGHPDETRHDAATRYSAAEHYLDGNRSPVANGVARSKIMLMFCVEDQSFAAIGRTINRSADSTKARVRHLLELLAEHYKNVDREAGISETASTKDAALKRVDPKL